jgi:essential nuclear protein 1
MAIGTQRRRGILLKAKQHKKGHKAKTIQRGGRTLDMSRGKRLLKSKDMKVSRKKMIQQKQKKKRSEIEKEKQELAIDNEIKNEGYFCPQEKFNLTEEDDLILRQFQLSTEDKKKKRKNSVVSESIYQKIEEKLEQQRQEEIKEDILKDPKVVSVYAEIARLMNEFTSGKLSKAFKFIPMMDQWEKVLQLTKPEEWSPQAVCAATKVFSSSLDIYKVTTFYEKYLLPIIRKDIKEHHKLNYHYYWALKDAFYKPAAWFKGIIFPLCQAQNCSIREATIIASVLNKLSIPVLHSSTAVMILCDMDYCGALCIFLKTMIEKRYSLPKRAVTSLVEHFKRFESDPRPLPVIWHQTFLSFATYYSYALDEMQKESLKQLAKKKHHHLITPEIIKAVANISKDVLVKMNLDKSHRAYQMDEGNRFMQTFSKMNIE